MSTDRFAIVVTLATLWIVLPPPASRAQDSLTTAPPTAIPLPDSLRPRVMADFGIFRPPLDSTSLLHRSRFLRTDAFHVAGLLPRHAGVTVRELGEPGLPEEAFLGGQPFRVVLDGHPFHDPVTGLTNFHLLPLEYLEAIQIDHPAAAPFWGSGAGGAAAHLVSRSWWTPKPVTKLRFLQGPHEHLLTDGMYSQNVSRSVNLTAGAQRHVANGRYENGGFESWNLRARLRWNPSDRINAALAYLYTHARIGMNGGVFTDSTLSVYEPASATVRFPEAREEAERNDITGTVAVRPFADSAWTTTIRLFLTDAQRTYTDATYPAWESVGTYSWERKGGRLEQRIEHAFHTTTLAGHLEHQSIRTDTLAPLSSLGLASLSVRSTFFPSRGLRPSLFFQEEMIRERWYTSAGVELSADVSEAISLSGAASRSRRVPTFRDLSFHLVPGKSIADLVARYDVVRFEVKGTWEGTQATIGVQRTATDPWLAVVAIPSAVPSRIFDLQPFSAGELILRSVDADVRLKLWRMACEIAFTYQEPVSAPAADPGLPRLSLVGEAMWVDDLFDGSLAIRAGVRVRHMGTAHPVRFHPAYGLFTAAEGSALPPVTMVDLVAVARIGDAHLHVSWENITNQQTYRVAAYPLQDSNVKLGVNWVFFD